VDLVPLVVGQADRDLVDDALVEDRLDLLEPAEDRPWQGRPGDTVVEEADDLHPELSMGDQLLRERLAPWARADDEDEAAVVAGPPVAAGEDAADETSERARRGGGAEEGARGEPIEQRRGGDGRKEPEEEEPADVDEAGTEEGCEDDRG